MSPTVGALGVKRWMKVNLERYRDHVTGEINLTQMAEEAASHFNLYDGNDIPEEVFDWSAEVAGADPAHRKSMPGAREDADLPVIAEFGHGPEPVRVVEAEHGGRPMYLAQVKSHVHGRWMTFDETRNRDEAIKIAEGWYPRTSAAEVYDEPGQWYRLVEIDSGPLAGQRFIQITDEDDDALVALADADGETVDLGDAAWTAIGKRTHDFDRIAGVVDSERRLAAEGGAAERLDEHGPLRTFWLLKGHDAGPFPSREEAEAERAAVIAEGAERSGISKAEFEAGMGFPGTPFLGIESIEREIWVTDADPRYDYEGYNFQVGEEGQLRVMALDPERTWYQVNRYASGLYFAAPYGSDNHRYYAEHPPARGRR